jgi:hypothetical protein
MNLSALSTAAPRHATTLLSDIFPGIRHALGDDRFVTLVDTYAAGQSDITTLVEHFPAYLRDRAPHLPYRNFLVQLATLEQTLHDIHRNDEHGDHLRLLRFDYPVSDYLRAVEQLIDEGAGDREVVGAPVAIQRCWVAVYRHGKQTGRITISPNHFDNVLDWLTQRQPDSVYAVSAVN